MATTANAFFSSLPRSAPRSPGNEAFPNNKTISCNNNFRTTKRNGIYCSSDKMSSSGVGEHLRTGTDGTGTKHKVEDYNTAMKRMMRNPYEYHHDLGMNYTHITDTLIVGSQPQKPEDIDHLKEEENVAYILCLQQDGDIEYWGIDFEAVVKRCKELGIHHMRCPVNRGSFPPG